jgi:hypothetical protein
MRVQLSALRQGEQSLEAFSNPEGGPELRNRMRFLWAFVPKRVRCACWDHKAVTRADPGFFASDHEYKRAGEDLLNLLLFGVHVHWFGGAGPIVRVEPDQGPIAVPSGDLEGHSLASSDVFDLIAGSWHFCTSVTGPKGSAALPSSILAIRPL